MLQLQRFLGWQSDPLQLLGVSKPQRDKESARLSRPASVKRPAARPVIKVRYLFPMMPTRGWSSSACQSLPKHGKTTLAGRSGPDRGGERGRHHISVNRILYVSAPP